MNSRIAWLFALIALLALPLAADAQNYVQQSGNVTQGHGDYWIYNGTIGDAGPATQGNITELGITKNGGLPFCIATSKSTPRQLFCFSVSDTNANITLQAYGEANATFTATLNGVVYPFPFTLSGIVGPATTVVGDAACWNNTVGTLLSDCGPGPNQFRKISTGTSDTATAADNTIAWNSASTSAKTETLYACGSSQAGFSIYVKDEVGTAGTYPITVTPNGSNTIDNQSLYHLSFNLQGANLQCDGSGNWIVK